MIDILEINYLRPPRQFRLGVDELSELIINYFCCANVHHQFIGDCNQKYLNNKYIAKTTLMHGKKSTI